MNKEINITAASIAQVSNAILGKGPRVDRDTYKAHVPAHVTKAGQVVAVAVAVAPIGKPSVAPFTSDQFLNAVKGLMDNNLENLVIHSPLVAIANSEIGEFWGITNDDEEGADLVKRKSIHDNPPVPTVGSPEDFEDGNFSDNGYDAYGYFNTVRTNNHISSEASFGDNKTWGHGSLDETHKQLHLYQISPEDISTLFTVHGTVNGKEIMHPLGAVLKENGISKLSAPITIASLSNFCPVTACPRHILNQTNGLAASILTTLQISIDRLGKIIQEVGLPDEWSDSDKWSDCDQFGTENFFKASANVSVPKDFIPLLIQEGSPFNILPDGVTASNLKFLDGEPYSYKNGELMTVTTNQGFSCDIHYGNRAISLSFRRQNKRHLTGRECAFLKISSGSNLAS